MVKNFVSLVTHWEMTPALIWMKCDKSLISIPQTKQR